MTKKIETIEAEFFGNDVDTFIKLPNGLIFLVSSVDHLEDAERVDKMPRDVVEISNPWDIEIPDWIWHEIGYVVTSSDIDCWELTGARTVTGAKKVCTMKYGAGDNSAILSIGIMDGRGRIILIANKSNHPGSEWENWED